MHLHHSTIILCSEHTTKLILTRITVLLWLTKKYVMSFFSKIQGPPDTPWGKNGALVSILEQTKDFSLAGRKVETSLPRGGGGYDMLRVRVCAAHMGRFFGSKLP